MPSVREVCLWRPEEEVVHDGAGVGDDPQQPVLLPVARLHLVVVLVQVVQQQRTPRIPQRHQLAVREPSKWPRLAEKRSRNRRMWLGLQWVGGTEASTRHLTSKVTGLLAALVTRMVA